jgi:hypothetical protein
MPGKHPVPPGTPPGPQNWPPDPQPPPARQPCPPAPPPGPQNWPPEPQLPLTSQPPPPGSCLKITCVATGLAAGPAANASAVVTGVTAIAAAAAPPITSVFVTLSFANITPFYPLPRVCKTSKTSVRFARIARYFSLEMLITLPSGARTKSRRSPHASVLNGYTIS